MAIALATSCAQACDLATARACVIAQAVARVAIALMAE